MTFAFATTKVAPFLNPAASNTVVGKPSFPAATFTFYAVQLLWSQLLQRRKRNLATPVDTHPPFRNLDAPEGMTSIGRTILIKGEVRSNEHLIIEGRIEGRVMVPEHGLAIGKHGNVSSEIMARTITVLGTVRGKITATDRVELLPTGRAEGRIVTKSLIIDEGAFFTGMVDPKLKETVLAVSRHRLKQETDDA